MDEAHRRLFNAFANKLDDRSSTWLETWNLLASDPCAREVLRLQLSWARRRYSLRAEQLEDIEQEVWFQLGRRLRNRPGLGLDRQRGERTFPAWLRTVFRRLVQQALRRRFRQPNHHSLYQDPASSEGEETIKHFDSAEAIRRLPGLQQACVMLFLDGYTIGETAMRLDISYAQARRQLQLALRQLRSDFEPM